MAVGTQGQLATLAPSGKEGQAVTFSFFRSGREIFVHFHFIHRNIPHTARETETHNPRHTYNENETRPSSDFESSFFLHLRKFHILSQREREKKQQ